jgi:hypothetical protein
MGRPHIRVTRRHFGLTAGCALASAAFSDACLVESRTSEIDERLTARPSGRVATSLVSGALGLGSGGRDGVVQVPAAAATGPVPLLVFLHGATQNGEGMLRRIGPAADQAGVAVLAPDSRGTTWDAIRDGFGDDVSFLDRALAHVFSRLAIDPASYRVSHAGKPVPLSTLEFRLLYYLASRPNRVFTRDQLLDAVWGTDRFVTPRSVDVYVRRLREKIESDPENPLHLKTVRGAGYLFETRAA